jgi:uncharacterized protein (UPF0212 family)
MSRTGSFKTIAVAALNVSRKEAAKRIAKGFLGECLKASALGAFEANVVVKLKYDEHILPAMAQHHEVKNALTEEIKARVEGDLRHLKIDIDYNFQPNGGKAEEPVPVTLKAALYGSWNPETSFESNVLLSFKADDFHADIKEEAKVDHDERVCKDRQRQGQQAHHFGHR